MEQTQQYQYSSKKEYSLINKKIVSNLRKEHESKQNSIYYTINVEYYYPYKSYYVVIPSDYLRQLKTLRKRKEDIFSKGKILTFSKKNNNFSFDAVIDSTENNYAYLVPIQEKYRYSRKSRIVGRYIANERTGDLTYYRMDQAINAFIRENCCSKNIQKFILGEKIENNVFNRELKYIFNYNKYYMASIYGFAELTSSQESQIKKLFYNEMNTIQISSKSDKKLICLIIYAIYKIRNNSKDKILVCSSSNSAADSVSLDLLKMKSYVKDFEVLRIYAKNQEIIKRNKKLKEISFHQLIRKEYKQKFKDRYEKRDWIINNRDIIVSTCVNSYNDNIINCHFPFVIIIDANNSTENENLIPITLKAKHVVLISYEGSDNDELNLYKRMNHLYPVIHSNI